MKKKYSTSEVLLKPTILHIVDPPKRFLNGNFLENFWLFLETMGKSPRHEGIEKIDYFHRAEITPVFLSVVVFYIGLKCTDQFPKNIC